MDIEFIKKLITHPKMRVTDDKAQELVDEIEKLRAENAELKANKEITSKPKETAHDKPELTPKEIAQLAARGQR